MTANSLTPRVGLSYGIDDRTCWKASWGQYTKFVPAGNVQLIYAMPDVPGAENALAGLGSVDPQECTSAELSYEKQVTDSVAYRITPYFSNYRNLGDYTTIAGITHYMNLGRGESRGVEFLVRKRMSNNWQGWLSYTRQTVKAGQAGSLLQYTNWDQRNTLAAVADYKTGKWTHTVRTDFGSGRADVGAPAGWTQRANPYAILTYGLTMDLPKGSRIGDSITLGVFNVTNNRQATQYTWSYGPRSADSKVGDSIGC